MLLYLSANTNIPDVYIDYIEVQLKNGNTVSLNWDESDISRTESGFDARYKGVYFGEEYANGRIDDLKDFKILDVGLYFESSGPASFQIVEMEFEDDGKSLTFSYPPIPRDCSGVADVEIPDAPADSEVNEYKIVDHFETETEHFFTVEVAPEMLVDVKTIPASGLVYVMDNGDGSTVYSIGDGHRDQTWPNFEYDEAAVMKLVKEADKRPALSDIIKSVEAKSSVFIAPDISSQGKDVAKDLFTQAFDHFKKNDLSMEDNYDYLLEQANKLIYCFQNNKYVDLIDIDFWVRYEALCGEALTFDEYLEIDSSFDGDPHDISEHDVQSISAFKNTLSVFREQKLSLESQIRSASARAEQSHSADNPMGANNLSHTKDIGQER